MAVRTCRIVLALLLVAAAAACGGGPVETPPPVPTVVPDPALVARLPPELAASRTISGGSSLTTAPLYFLGDDGATPTGLVIDLVDNAATHLGLRVAWKQIPYAGLVPALGSQQIRVTGAQFSPTKENLAAASIVTLFRTTTSFLVPAGNPAGFRAPLDSCGHVLAITRGSVPDKAVVDDLAAQCTAAGRPPPTLTQYAGAGDAELALRAGRADAFVLATPSCRFAHGAYPNVFDVAMEGAFSPRTAGVAFAKADTALATLFQAAFQRGIDDGSSATILARWGVSDLAVPRSLLNTPGA